MNNHVLAAKGELHSVLLDVLYSENKAIRITNAITNLIAEMITEAEEKPAAPEIPEGWFPASEPPDDERDVKIMHHNGYEAVGYNGDQGNWFRKWERVGVLGNQPSYCKTNDVLCWQELDAPAPKPLAVGDTFTVTFTVAKDRTWFNVALGHIPALSKSGLNYGIKLSDIDGQEVAK